MKNAFMLLKEFEKLGYKAYIVGGSVRDYLLKSDSFDIDIATSATPDEVMANFKSVPIGLKYGTVLVCFEGEKFEVTTFRKDLTYYNNRHPDSVIFSQSIEEDVLRRDFTINVMYLDTNFEIIDLVNGQEDLKKRLIKTIGNPNERFKEDALRILRAFYLVSKLNFHIEKNTLNSIIKNKELIKNVSAERIFRELEKIISYENSFNALELLIDTGVYLYLPGLSKGIKYMVDNNIDLKGQFFFAMCFYKNGKIDKFWKISNSEKKIYQGTLNLLNAKETFNNNLLYQHKLEEIIMAAKLNEYLNIYPLNQEEMIKMYYNLPIKEEKELKITNKEIISLVNQKPGAWLKELKKEIIDQILSNKLDNDYDEISKYIEKRKDKNEK